MNDNQGHDVPNVALTLLMSNTSDFRIRIRGRVVLDQLQLLQVLAFSKS